jgi:hypothetical protein
VRELSCGAEKVVVAFPGVFDPRDVVRIVVDSGSDNEI